MLINNKREIKIKKKNTKNNNVKYIDILCYYKLYHYQMYQSNMSAYKIINE